MRGRTGGKCLIGRMNTVAEGLDHSLVMTGSTVQSSLAAPAPQ
jgi:transketolase C-terminal domain/subunit